MREIVAQKKVHRGWKGLGVAGRPLQEGEESTIPSANFPCTPPGNPRTTTGPGWPTGERVNGE